MALNAALNEGSQRWFSTMALNEGPQPSRRETCRACVRGWWLPTLMTRRNALDSRMPYDPDSYRDPFQLFANQGGALVPWIELSCAEQAFYHLQASERPAGLELEHFLDLVGAGRYADRDESSWTGAS